MSATAQSLAAAPDAYDEVPYESFTYPATHPYHIGAVARLFGLTPPDFTKAKVLELGCASGGNLFSLAGAYPKARFTGIDLSGEQIALANRHKKTLGLKNIEFEQKDIMAFDLNAHRESYDYIICHGVLSWVPAAVQDKIMELCGACLSPDGVALISYNTLPGWNAVRSLREMMLYHTARFTNPAEKVSQARALLDFLIENVPEGRAGYRAVIEEERKMLKGTNDSYLYHDHLETNNRQFYFHEFAELANARGLAYVGDSNVNTMFLGNLPAQAARQLQAVDNIVRQEQYMDFISNRRFRMSIVCKNAAKLNRNLQKEQILDFHLTANMTPETANADPRGSITFRSPANVTFTTQGEIPGTLFLELIAAGKKPVRTQDLIGKVQKKLKLPSPDPVRDVLVQYGLELALRGCVALHADSPAFVTKAGERPVVLPFARLQASMPGCTCVTNALHASVPVNGVACIIMAALDGTVTRDELADRMTERVLKGELTVTKDNVILKDRQAVHAEILRNVDDVLKGLAENAILIA